MFLFKNTLVSLALCSVHHDFLHRHTGHQCSASPVAKEQRATQGGYRITSCCYRRQRNNTPCTGAYIAHSAMCTGCQSPTKAATTIIPAGVHIHRLGPIALSHVCTHHTYTQWPVCALRNGSRVCIYFTNIHTQTHTCSFFSDCSWNPRQIVR